MYLACTPGFSSLGGNYRIEAPRAGKVRFELFLPRAYPGCV